MNHASNVEITMLNSLSDMVISSGCVLTSSKIVNNIAADSEVEKATNHNNYGPYQNNNHIDGNTHGYKDVDHASNDKDHVEEAHDNQDNDKGHH